MDTLTAVTGITKMPPKVRAFLSKPYRNTGVVFGTWKVIRVTIFRESVAAAIQVGVKLLTGGSLKGNLLHVFMIVTLKNPGVGNGIASEVNVLFEKNECVGVELLDHTETMRYFNNKKKTRMQITTDGRRTLSDAFNNVERFCRENHLSLWKYDAGKANCQKFVWWFLKANNYYFPHSKLAVKQFVIQANVESGVGSGRASKLMGGVTSGAAAVKHLLGFADGELLKTSRKRKREASPYFPFIDGIEWVD